MERFDPTEVLERVGGDTELLAHLADVLATELPAMLGRVQDAVKAGDAAELYRAAHAIKGALSVFGYPPATDAATELERRGKEGELERTTDLSGDLEHHALTLLVGLSAFRLVEKRTS